MPCYQPPPSRAEIEEWSSRAKAQGNWDEWYDMLTEEQLKAMLCDVIRDITNDHFNGLHEDIKRVYQIHRRKEGK